MCVCVCVCETYFEDFIDFTLCDLLCDFVNFTFVIFTHLFICVLCPQVQSAWGGFIRLSRDQPH